MSARPSCSAVAALPLSLLRHRRCHILPRLKLVRRQFLQVQDAIFWAAELIKDCTEEHQLPSFVDDYRSHTQFTDEDTDEERVGSTLNHHHFFIFPVIPIPLFRRHHYFGGGDLGRDRRDRL